MPDPFLDYLHESELGRGTMVGTTLPEIEKPKVSFAKPLMRTVIPEPEPIEEDPFLAHLRGLETIAPPPPTPQRGVLGDIASSLARGVAVGVPQFAGQAITGLGALTGVEPMKETGRAITGFAEELPEKIPFLAPSEAEEQGGFRRFLTGMGESLPVILGAAKAGAAIGGLTAPITGLIGPTAGAILGGMVGIFGTFGLAGKGRAYDEAISQGLPEEEAQSYSNKIGAIEGGVWSLLAPVEAATGGLAGRFVKKPAVDTIRKLLTPRLTQSMVGLATNVPLVTAAGATSAGLQARAAEEAGLPGPTPEEAAYDAVAPSVGISILFGLASRGMRYRDRQAIFTSLRNETVDPAFRQRASDAVYGRLRGIDPEIAEMWKREAGYRIEGQKSIPIDEDYMAWLQKGMAERIPATWGTPGGGLPVPFEEARYMGRMRPEEELQIPWLEPPGVKRGEGFVMAEPWVVQRGTETLELPGQEAMKLLTGTEKPIPQIPFYPPPVGTTLGQGFRMQEPVQPKVYAKIAEDTYREVIRIGEDGRPILGDKAYKRSQIVPKEATVKTGKGRIAPEAGVTSAGVLPTERPSPPAPGAQITLPGEKKTIPPALTPGLIEKGEIPPISPLPEAQMEAIRAEGNYLGGLGIALIQRVSARMGNKINAKKGTEVLEYLQKIGEIEPQVGGGRAIFPYVFTGKTIPKKTTPTVPLPEGSTPYKGYGYIKTGPKNWEVHGPEGKVETTTSRDAARITIDRIKSGEKPPVVVPPTPPLAPPPGEIPPPPVLGRPEEVVTPRGIKIKTAFKVVEADDLITSIDANFKENPKYLRELQPRDRDKVTSMNQVMRIYNKLDPEQLAESRGADTGAPIVGTDNMVESGNGRVVALKKLYTDAHANAEKYRAWLNQNAERFGLTKDQVEGIKNPVLVRENDTKMTPEQRISFAQDANTPTTLVMSAGEKAKIDMDRLTTDVLSVFAPDESGNLLAASNREFIRSFLAKVPTNEMGEFITEKEGGLGGEAKLSAQGLTRIKNAIFAKAYGRENADIITMMTEDPENNIKNITNALLTAAPKQAGLMEAIKQGDRHDLSISKEISDAAKKFSDLRNAGSSVDEYLIQGNLFGKNPIETELVKMFNDWKQNPKKIVDTLESYAKMVDEVGNPRQKGLFGAEKPPSKLSVLEAARRLTEEKYVTPEQKGLFPTEIQRVRSEPPGQPIQETPPGGIPEIGKTPGEKIPRTDKITGEGVPRQPSPELAPKLTNEEFADVISSMKKTLSGMGIQGFSWDAILSDKPLDPALKAASELFKRPVYFIKASRGILPFNGFVDAIGKYNRMFINENTDRPILAVFGHELTHILKKSNPDIYSKFFDHLQIHDKKFDNYYGRYKEKSRRDEIISDYIGESMVKPDFWNSLAEKEPDLFKRMVSLVIEWIQNIRKRLASIELLGLTEKRPVEKMFADLEAADKAAKGAISEFAKRNKGAEDLMRKASEPFIDVAREKIPKIDGLLFNGIQEIPGEPSQYVFTDRQTRSTFYSKSLDPKFLEKERDRIRTAFEKDAMPQVREGYTPAPRYLVAAVRADGEVFMGTEGHTGIAMNSEFMAKIEAAKDVKKGWAGPDGKFYEDIKEARDASDRIFREESRTPDSPATEKIANLRNQLSDEKALEPPPKAGEMGKASDEEPYFDLADNPMTEGSWWDSVKDFKNKYTLGIKGSDLKWSERLYMLPWHIGQKFNNFRKLIDVQLNRDESREQMNHEMVQKAFAESKTEAHEFLALPKDQAKDIFRIMVWSDDQNVFFGKIGKDGIINRDIVSLQSKAKELLGKELTEDQVTAYYAWKKTMDSAWARVKKQHEVMTFAPYEDREWYSDLIQTYRRWISSDKKKVGSWKNFIDSTILTSGKWSQSQMEDIGRDAIRLEKPVSRLKELRDDMGRWQYYVPRVREKGDYVIRGFNKEGKIVVSVRAMDQIRGAKARDRFMKEYPGLRWESKFEPQPIEEMYQRVSDIHLEQFIKKGINRAKIKGKITDEEADNLTDSLYEAVADDLKARGFASHFIMREEGASIKGYETENGQKVFYDYMTGLSGFLTKQRAAFDFFKALEGIDPSKQPELFKEGSSYVEDMLRNSDRLDKLSGKIRAAAFTWYLSGSVKAAMVQFTQNFVTGVPHLGRITKNPLKKYVQSMKDIAAWKFNPNHLNKEEQTFLHEMHERGIDTAQYLREIRGRMKSQFGGTLDQIGQVLATPFSGMEVFNRESASLAMFRVMRNEKRMSYREAFDAARDYVYNTHYLYGKSNLPAWARAGTPGSRLARTAYTFRSFNHNFLLSLMQSLKGPDGKIALDTMGRTMAYLAIFGGATAIPFFDDLLDGMERMSGTPYKSNMRKVMQGIGGAYLSRFGMEGLPAILGADLTGSLKIGIPTVSFSDVYGVYGGFWDKGKRAIDSFQRADIYRGIESLMPTFIEAPMKGYRMATEGATTPTGKVMFDEEGKPITLTPSETGLQTLGFRPERISVIGKEKRSLANLEQHYSGQRDDLYSKLRISRPTERTEILKQIRDYNLEVQKYKGIIPPISQEMIRNALKQKPDKKFVRFEGG